MVLIWKMVMGIGALILLSGCTVMKPKDFVNKGPKLILEEFFAGKTRGWGIFEDRFGNVKRQFVVDIDGAWDGKTLTLDEKFVYNDGEKSTRQWQITKTGESTYKGTATDVVGSATGVASGNSLYWTYILNLKTGEKMKWHVTFKDWMFLQPGNVLLNRARMSKFGIQMGEVTLAFMKVKNLAEDRASISQKFVFEENVK